MVVGSIKGSADNNGVACAAAGGSGGQVTLNGSQNNEVGAAARPRTFNFDYAFGPNATQLNVYDTAVAPLMSRFVEGYNVTVLAYGQTSSGKTYTMGTGANMVNGSFETMGVVPRALQSLFSWAQAPAAATHASTLRAGIDIRISFVEVHNETLVDLVAQPRSRGAGPSIVIREDGRGNVLWNGVEEVAVATADAAMGILMNGSRARKTSATRMNAVSSRSHAIYTVTLTQTQQRGNDGGRDAEPVRVVSKLHFVDLAGSERLNKTQEVGERRREGISINSGLLALGNVISALSNTRRGASNHVPYRDSKLTYMLRDSLGGSAQTLMIACISAAKSNAVESGDTLKYASRARAIKNRGGIHAE
ncbi:kinesin-domain-containing protein, partial [Coemansia reversa NRRL 1564]